MYVNLPSGIDGGLLATQLADLTNNANSTVRELLEILRGDAWS
jgi:hypothetical protein